MRPHLLLTAVALAGSPDPARADERAPRPLLVDDAILVIDEVAGRVVRVRDVDGDGAHELVVPRGPHALVVRAFDLVSGRTGATILRLTEFCGDACAPSTWDAGGDVDADGVPDLVLGYPGHGNERGLVHVVSGRNASLVRALAGERDFDRFGAALTFVGDVDGDGRDDAAIGAPGVRPSSRLLPRSAEPPDGYAGGRVVVVSGADGRALWRKVGDAGDALGGGLAAIGDLDGDGRTDLAASARWGRGGPLRLLSGSDGRTIAKRDIRAGVVLATGDVDCDGAPDLALDLHRDYAKSGRVALVSGASGAVLAEYPYPDIMPDFGGPMGVGDIDGDIDGDGVPDLAIGDANYRLPADAPDVRTLSFARAANLESRPSSVSWESGCVVVRSGRTGEVVFGVWAPRERTIGLGLEVARGPDVDGDGWEDLLVNDDARSLVFRVVRSRREPAGASRR